MMNINPMWNISLTILICCRCHLKDAVVASGIAFNRAHNLSLYDYLRIEDRFNKLFNDVVSGHSIIIMRKMLEKYKGFEGVSSLVDVAGNIGIDLNMIISKYPTIKGINFDLPHVIKDAPTYKGAILSFFKEKKYIYVLHF